ncbi:hypothetical protein ROG8370_02241 [Roseovarius gaetbuli]|uniref:Uncharacterized protein n=1 Tax=Roseovarius gaetbuli TaxID=1356575 RepID=A0A1X6ZFU4_9RHOB|nr:hypothetical protein ROG8370_02241 [Roseovarius gaetbuli]
MTWAENDGAWPRMSSDDPAFFYTLRAGDHKDADLVHMLLADLSPKDIRQLFICHKPLFYRKSAGWSKATQDYVVDFPSTEYQINKMGALERWDMP